MKLIKVEIKTAANAWGQYLTMQYSTYEIEEKDIGIILHHQFGFKSGKSYKITSKEVGKTLTYLKDIPATEYTCWGWN